MNIITAQSAMLYGRSTVQRWAKEFERMWYKPQSDLMLQAMWEMLDPEDVEAMRQEYPEQVEAYEKYLGQIGGK